VKVTQCCQFFVRSRADVFISSSVRAPGGFILLLAACFSCMATHPITPSTKSKVSGIETQSIDVHSRDQKASVIERVVISPIAGSNPAEEFAMNVQVRTATEVWCERQCSDYTLAEETADGVFNLKALKKPIVGNTKPGALDVKKELRVSKSGVKKILILNVGSKGEAIDVEAVMPNDKPNFYAVPASLVRESRGGESKIFASFDDQKYELRLEGACKPPEFSADGVTAQVFLMGSLMRESNKGAEQKFFLASKIISPWSGE